MLRTFFLILLSIVITGYCLRAPPLPMLGPVPFSCFTHGIIRHVWVRPAGCRQPVLTALIFSSNQHVFFGCLSWFEFLSSQLSRSLLLHLQVYLLGQKEEEHLSKENKSVIHTDVPVTRLRESASIQAQNCDSQNLAEQVQSLPCASTWRKSSLIPQKLASSFKAACLRPAESGLGLTILQEVPSNTPQCKDFSLVCMRKGGGRLCENHSWRKQ